MSIFSSVSCPKCNKGECGIALAHGGFNKVRLGCEECGEDTVVKLSEDDFTELARIFDKIADKTSSKEGGKGK